MESLKKTINILVMVYLVIVLLFLLRILSVDKFVALFDMTEAAVFYNRLLWAGAVLLLAELLLENAYIATLKRGLEREHRQLTQLKAQLYDERMKAEAAASGPEPREVHQVPAAPAAAHLQEPIITQAPAQPDVPPDLTSYPDQRPLP